jgi:hypothetical protein
MVTKQTRLKIHRELWAQYICKNKIIFKAPRFLPISAKNLKYAPK